MDSKICFEMSVFVVEAIMWTMCELHDCNCNGLADTWWTDKCTYFSRLQDSHRNLIIKNHDFSVTFYAVLNDFYAAMKANAECHLPIFFFRILSHFCVGSIFLTRRLHLTRCHGQGVVAGSRATQIYNISDAISKFVHITHECMDSEKLLFSFIALH